MVDAHHSHSHCSQLTGMRSKSVRKETKVCYSLNFMFSLASPRLSHCCSIIPMFKDTCFYIIWRFNTSSTEETAIFPHSGIVCLSSID